MEKTVSSLNQQVWGCKLLLKQLAFVLWWPLYCSQFIFCRPRGQWAQNRGFPQSPMYQLSLSTLVGFVSHHCIVYCSPRGKESEEKYFRGKRAHLITRYLPVFSCGNNLYIGPPLTPVAFDRCNSFCSLPGHFNMISRQSVSKSCPVL